MPRMLQLMHRLREAPARAVQSPRGVHMSKKMEIVSQRATVRRCFSTVHGLGGRAGRVGRVPGPGAQQKVRVWAIRAAKGSGLGRLRAFLASRWFTAEPSLRGWIGGEPFVAARLHKGFGFGSSNEKGFGLRSPAQQRFGFGSSTQQRVRVRAVWAPKTPSDGQNPNPLCKQAAARPIARATRARPGPATQMAETRTEAAPATR